MSLRAEDQREEGGFRERAEPIELESERCSTFFGGCHSHLVIFARNLAVNLRRSDELGEVIALDEETLDAFRETLGEDDSMTLAFARNLAVNLRRTGELGEVFNCCRPEGMTSTELP